MERKILVFYPMDFYEMSAGTHRRVHQVLSYLNKRGFSIDLLSLSGYSNKWTSEHAEKRELCNNIKICEWKTTLLEKVYFEKAQRTGDLPDFSIVSLKKEFQGMFSEKNYDFVLINYVYWASLAAFAKNATKVIDLHDFLTLNNFMKSGSSEFRQGRMFESEIKAISKFDYALSISEEEALMLGQFCPLTSFVNAPVFYPRRQINKKKKPLYDILFVGSDNEFNRDGLRWFITEVHSLLPEKLRIAIVGKAASFVDKRDNIELIPHVEDLDSIYADTRLVICPLKGGTGLKVKVIEALSYGLPVVTTSWGLKGILNKSDNGCVTADDARGFANKIRTLLENRKEYERQNMMAVEFFNRNYAEDICHERLDKVFCSEKG